MLGAFRRSGVIHALRTSTRTLPIRSTPQRFQCLSSTVSSLPHTSRSLYHSTSSCLSAPTNAAVRDDALEAGQEPPSQATQFKELAAKGLVDPIVIKAVTEKMRLKDMTDVQSLTIPESLKGHDILAQAKTGTGKTLAFLIPVMQKVLSDPTIEKMVYDRWFQRGSRRRYGHSGASAADIRAIIISPTRELAEQIAVEARRVSFSSGLVVQTAVGGTQRRSGLQQIQNEGCHILVGTPGRLKDLLTDPRNGIEAPKLCTLVLDEADRLLDDGFAPELMEIQRLLPDPTKVDRQTLMFSATVPSEVMGMVRQTMKPDFKFLKTIRDNEVPTHLTVPQKAVILDGYQNLLPAILELVKNNLNNDRPFKAIVYFNSTKQVNLAFEVFDRLLRDPENPRSGHPFGRMFLGEIHARLSQNQRTQVSKFFRSCSSGILFSSDVTARGMDFPEVTHVLQVGVPRGRDSYIHRLGRTARANKTGEGWVFLMEEEMGHLNRLLSDIPIDRDYTSLPTASIDMRNPHSETSQHSPETEETFQQIKAALSEIPDHEKALACQAQMSTMLEVFASRKQAMLPIIRDLALHGYHLRQVPPPPKTVERSLRTGRRGSDRGRHSSNFSRSNSSRSDFRSGGRQGRSYKEDDLEAWQRIRRSRR